MMMTLICSIIQTGYDILYIGKLYSVKSKYHVLHHFIQLEPKIYFCQYFCLVQLLSNGERK